MRLHHKILYDLALRSMCLYACILDSQSVASKLIYNNKKCI